MSAEVVVGLDVGTTGVKAVAVEPNGRVAAVAEQGYSLSTPRAGWSEQDPEDWWRGTRAVLAAVRSRARVEREIAGIGLSGQMHGLVALDAGGGSSARRSSGTTSAPGRSAPRSRSESASSG